MSSLFKQFATNIEKEINGVPVTFDANDDGTIPTFIIAFSGGGNQFWAKILDEELSPYRRLQELGKLSTELNDKVIMRTFARAALKGWLNVYDIDDKPIEFSIENAIQLFTQLPHLFRVLQVKANSVSTYQDLTSESKN